MSIWLHILLISFSYCCFGILFAASSDFSLRNSGVCSEDCIKNILKEILFRYEPLDSATDKVEFKIKLPRSEYDKLVEYISNEETWTSGDTILEMLYSGTERVQEDDYGHIYQEGLSPKFLILLCTGSFAAATIWMILTRKSNGLAAVLVMTLAFFCGLAWNWWKTYMEEFHRRVHLLPNECKMESTSWYHSVKGFIIDPQCSEYFKSPVDDPLSMVSPGNVLEATFSMLFIQPLILTAGAFTTTVHSLTENLVWPLNWILQSILSLIVVGGFIVVMLIVLATFFNRELSFSMGIIKGRIHHHKEKTKNQKSINRY